LVVETLRQAAGDGRLTLEELDQRLEGAHAAKTYGELEKLTEDLPAALLPEPVGGSLPAQRHPDPGEGITATVPLSGPPVG
jgi:hypothetical protein